MRRPKTLRRPEGGGRVTSRGKPRSAPTMTSFVRVFVALAPLVGLLSSCAGASPAGSAAAPAEAAPPEIAWLNWGAPAFERARREGKMVLVDVGIEGCTACRWMFEDTYRDPAVMRRVTEHFVPIAVDAHVRPDLGDRYARWGWPATIVLSPAGAQVFAVRGNKRPRNFIPILDELIDRHRRGDLEAEAETTIATPAPAGALVDACSDIARQLAASADLEHGGWATGVKHVSLAPVEHALLRAHLSGDDESREQALRTLEGWARLIDPVWGGIFVAARHPDWTGPIPEKRLVHQAAALTAFADAFLITGDRSWLNRAEDIHRYAATVMQHGDGTWYATQEDAAPGLPEAMDAARYYELSDGDRRRYGVPPVDHGVYTDLNGLMIRAYARLYEATGDARFLGEARRAADALLGARRLPSGAVAQSADDRVGPAEERMRVYDGAAADRLFLRAQPAFGLALTALYRATGEVHYRDASAAVADAMVRELDDSDGGGFFATTAADTDGLIPRDKPFRDNVFAARLLLALATDTGRDAYREAAERTLSAVVGAGVRSGNPARIAELGLALEDLAHGAVEFSIVTGDPSAPDSRALFAAALGVYEPRKALHFEAPGRYPDLGRAAIFVCTDNACSSPVFDPGELRETASHLGALPPGSACTP